MRSKYLFLDAETARELLRRVRDTAPAKQGFDRRAWLFDDYAVLSTGRLKVRNAVFPDDDLTYFDDIIMRLARLYCEGVAVVPILGYCYDPESPEGEGYIFQRRAPVREMYDDAAICALEVWTQDGGEIYLKSDIDAGEYILSRTHEIAAAPQEHFDKFIRDIRAILGAGILIDFQGKSNFFYHEDAGFSFIDLDSHTDNVYDPEVPPIDVDAVTAMGGFVPCHFSAETQAFAPFALDEKVIGALEEENLRTLRADNLRIFEKCRAAMDAGGLPEAAIRAAMEKIRVFGQ